MKSNRSQTNRANCPGIIRHLHRTWVSFRLGCDLLLGHSRARFTHNVKHRSCGSCCRLRGHHVATDTACFERDRVRLSLTRLAERTLVSEPPIRCRAVAGRFLQIANISSSHSTPRIVARQFFDSPENTIFQSSRTSRGRRRQKVSPSACA